MSLKDTMSNLIPTASMLEEDGMTLHTLDGFIQEMRPYLEDAELFANDAVEPTTVTGKRQVADNRRDVELFARIVQAKAALQQSLAIERLTYGLVHGNFQLGTFNS